MDEYISREKTMKAIGHSDTTQPSYTTEFFTSLKTRIKAMIKVGEIPSADVAPVVHGEWMKNRKLWHYCSVCLEDALMSRSTGEEVLSETCPHCGAKMDGGTMP